MAITDTGGGAVNNTNNAATYATGSFTPAANDLIVTLGAISDTALDATLTDSGGVTQTLLIGEAFTSGVPMMGYVHISAALVAATSRTFTYDVTGDNGTGCHMTCRRIAGGRATAPFHRQFAFNTGAASTTPTVTFDNPCNTNNAVLGIVVASSAAPFLTQPSGWAEILDQSHATPTQGMHYSRILSGETGITITWGSAPTTAWFAAAIEIYEAAQPGNNPWFFRNQVMCERLTKIFDMKSKGKILVPERKIWTPDKGLRRHRRLEPSFV